MANTAIIRDAYGIPAMFVGSKTGKDDAPLSLSGSAMRNAGCGGQNGMRFPPGLAFALPGRPSPNGPSKVASRSSHLIS
jgi:hypothetical protein